MNWKRAVTVVAAVITFAGSANLMTAQEDPLLCTPHEPVSFVFLGQCPGDIAGVCSTWGFTGAGTLGICVEEAEGFRVTCSCQA